MFIGVFVCNAFITLIVYVAVGFVVLVKFLFDVTSRVFQFVVGFTVVFCLLGDCRRFNTC